MLSIFVIWWNIVALKKLRFKIIMKCLKKSKNLLVLPYSFSPIDCSIIKTVRKTKNEISISITNILIIRLAIGL